MTHILYHFAVCYVWQDSSGVIHVSGLDIVAGGYILRFSIMIDSNFITRMFHLVLYVFLFGKRSL